jgi:hypothetical protein
VDRFPEILSAPHEWPHLGHRYAGLSEWCILEVVDQTVYLIDRTPDLSTRRNGQMPHPEQDGVIPLLPGDRIQVEEFEFVVSYERLTSAVPEPVAFPDRRRGSNGFSDLEPATHDDLNAAQTEVAVVAAEADRS